MRRMICGVIRAYQIAISPLLPAACRFTPTCSRYALEAVARFGALRPAGSFAAIRSGVGDTTRCRRVASGRSAA